ncbi:MAG: Na+/H+ antiporter [Proteobacteria bacterium]|nr:Na+/H+ antiporter [Pseudomonadota bacterium]
METTAIVLLLLAAVVISGALARISRLPLPLPLVQIGLGAIIDAFGNLGVQLDPNIFFLVFLPPLLFLDGWRIPKERLLRDRWTVLELALGLVVFTVLGLGYFVHWMIPSMPLAVAFALAAILSPTDPVAVSAIAKRMPIPGRLLHILEGESLLNDASGLVCMRFAVAAALTGTFSLTAALGTFLWLALGGLFIGWAVTWITVAAKNWVFRHFGEEPGAQILISLLIPFGAYLVAEEFRCSGILAAVAAGVSMGYAEQSGQALAVTRVRRNAVWDTVAFAANGIIFVLLGEQLPQIVTGAVRVVRDTGHRDVAWLGVYVVAITAALALLRFLWVWASLRFTLSRASRRGGTPNIPSWRLIMAASLAGVRGAITLAGVLTLPLLMPNGDPFPARELAVFLAAGVIIVSLVSASVGLPRLLKNLEIPPEPSQQAEEDRARAAAAKAAIEAVELALREAAGTKINDLYPEAGARIVELYRQRINGLSKTGDDGVHQRKLEAIERRLRLSALRAERNEIYRLSRAHRVSEETSRKLVSEIDLLETRFSTP